MLSSCESCESQGGEAEEGGGPPVKSWSTKGFIRMVRDGHALLVEGISQMVSRRADQQLREPSSDSSQQSHYKLDMDVNNPRRPTSLRYGFDVLANLNAVLAQWPLAHLFDMRSLSIPSKFFAGFLYLQVLLSAVVGVLVIALVGPELRHLPLDYMRIGTVFSIMLQASQLVYHLSNLMSCSLLVYHRKFLHDFLLYKCPIISLPLQFQRHLMVSLFVALNLLTIISEPLFVAWTIWSNFDQTILFDGLSAGLFGLIKALVIVIFSFGAAYSDSLGMQIPIATLYLIQCSAAHIKLQLGRQLSRLNDLDLDRLRRHDDQPTRALDRQSQQLVAEFSCNTLLSDWPPILYEDGEERSPATHLSADLSSALATSTSDSAPGLIEDPSSSPPQLSAPVARGPRRSSSQANRIMFVYKSLLKSLTELKGFIQGYEQHFGNLHIINLMLNCFNVSQWVTASFFDRRQRKDSADSPDSPDSADSPSISAFKLRVLIRAATFVASLFYYFLKSNSLSSELNKLRCQLSRFNTDLARAKVRQLSLSGQFEPDPNSSRPASSLALVKQPDNLDAEEIEQVWLLFDQIERMSRFVRFRLTGDMVYDKRCLLQILSQTGSLVLLSIQLVEMYAQL